MCVKTLNNFKGPEITVCDLSLTHTLSLLLLHSVSFSSWQKSVPFVCVLSEWARERESCMMCLAKVCFWRKRVTRAILCLENEATGLQQWPSMLTLEGSWVQWVAVSSERGCPNYGWMLLLDKSQYNPIVKQISFTIPV